MCKNEKLAAGHWQCWRMETRQLISSCMEFPHLDHVYGYIEWHASQHGCWLYTSNGNRQGYPTSFIGVKSFTVRLDKLFAFDPAFHDCWHSNAKSPIMTISDRDIIIRGVEKKLSCHWISHDTNHAVFGWMADSNPTNGHHNPPNWRRLRTFGPTSSEKDNKILDWSPQRLTSFGKFSKFGKAWMMNSL